MWPLFPSLFVPRPALGAEREETGIKIHPHEVEESLNIYPEHALLTFVVADSRLKLNGDDPARSPSGRVRSRQHATICGGNRGAEKVE